MSTGGQPVRDGGAPDPRLAAALAAWTAASSSATAAEVHAAFAGARVYAAITATSTGERVDERTGLLAESSAELALLTLVGSAGGRAVPLFLDVGAVVGFRAGARPLPLPGPDACTAALQDGAVAVLLEPSGAAFVVTGSALADLAAGRVPIAGTTLSSRRTAGGLTHPRDGNPALVRALADALTDEPVRAARLLAGPDGPVLGLVPEHPLDAAALTALAARVLQRLSAVLPPEGLDLAVVAPTGPGLPVRLKKRWRSGRTSN
ncbi:MAG: SseB family protein [Mycobacteriales bacterium]